MNFVKTNITCTFPIPRRTSPFILVLPRQSQDVIDGMPRSGGRTGHHPQRLHLQGEPQHVWGIFTTIRFHHATWTDWRTATVRFLSGGGLKVWPSICAANGTSRGSIMESDAGSGHGADRERDSLVGGRVKGRKVVSTIGIELCSNGCYRFGLNRGRESYCFRFLFCLYFWYCFC